MKNTKKLKCVGLLVLLATLTGCTISKAMQEEKMVQEKISKEDANKMLFDAKTPEDVELALKAGADIDAEDTSGCMPLQSALERDLAEVALKLIENGADVNIVFLGEDVTIWSPLHLACCSGDLMTVALKLIEKKANVNFKDQLGFTPLFFACRENLIPVISELIKSGANVNTVNNKGLTPLHLACEFNRIDTVQLLLEKGANIDQKILKQARDNLKHPAMQVLAQQILAMFKLTQRFDKCAKTGEFFGLTSEEEQNDELREFTDRLLQSKRKEIIRNREPKKSRARTLVEEGYRPLDDCAVVCDSVSTRLEDDSEGANEGVMIAGLTELDLQQIGLEAGLFASQFVEYKKKFSIAFDFDEEKAGKIYKKQFEKAVKQLTEERLKKLAKNKDK